MKFIQPNLKIRIVLTGGGTGGHVFPLVAVLRELKKYVPDFEKQELSLEFIYFGTPDFTLDYLKREDIPIKVIHSAKFYKISNFNDILQDIKNFFLFLWSFFETFWYLFVIMPDVIFAKGSFASFPTLFIATLFRIPIFIHESDSIPGKVNKMFSRFSIMTFISFEITSQYLLTKRYLLTGNPLRGFLKPKENENIDIKIVKQSLGLEPNRNCVLVLGGSQGAETINDLVLDSLPLLINEVEIIHQSGPNNYERVRREAEVMFREFNIDEQFKQYYHLVPFLEEKDTPSLDSLRDCLLASDLVVSRSGSGSIFEIAAFGKPAILIPLPWSSQDHQTLNALEYSKGNRAIVLEQANLKASIFSDTIKNLLHDPQKLELMSQKAKEFAKVDAANIISEEILKFIVNKYR